MNVKAKQNDYLLALVAAHPCLHKLSISTHCWQLLEVKVQEQ